MPSARMMTSKYLWRTTWSADASSSDWPFVMGPIAWIDIVRASTGFGYIFGVPLRAPESIRIDRFLHAARAFKSRTDAQAACTGGRVLVNGASVKASHAVRVGDEIRTDAPRGTIVWLVLALAEKRLSPALARKLYEDHSPPPPPREERFPQRSRGAGRPTKRERRNLSRFRGDF
jgi:ribosome-associated heat shock protein Hsp15